MRITLGYDAFDSIMKACKPFVAKSTTRPVLTQIELSCDGDTVTATALDGVKVISMTVPCDLTSDTGKVLIPLVKPIGKKGVYAEITDTDKEVTIRTIEGSQSFRKVEDAFIDHSRFFPNKVPESVCYFDPTLLAEAFSSFKDGRVKIEYYGNRIGVVISNPVQKALVLPTRPLKNENQ